MKYYSNDYKNYKGIEDDLKKIKMILGEVEYIQFKNKPIEFYNIKHNFIETKNIIIFYIKGTNNSLGPHKVGSEILSLIDEGRQVGLILGQDLSNTNKNCFVRSSKNLGVEVYNPNNWNEGSVKTPGFVIEDANTLLLKSHAIEKNTDGFYQYSTQDTNSFPIFIRDAFNRGLKVYVESFDTPFKKGSQQGLTKETRKILDAQNQNGEFEWKAFEIANHEKVKAKNIKIINNREPAEIPELKNTFKRSSENNETEVNNLHKILVNELYNALLKNKTNQIDISYDGNNGLNIDVLEVWENRAKIYEVKSFSSKTYYKAVGQLLTYRERVSKTYGINSDNIEMIIYLKNNTTLDIDFENMIKKMNIKIEIKK